jgi:hypothetical protein
MLGQRHLWIRMAVEKGISHVAHPVAAPDENLNPAGDDAPNYRGNEAHQPLRLPDLAIEYGGTNDQKHIVDHIIEVARPQLAPQVETNTCAHNSIQFFKRGIVSRADFSYDTAPPHRIIF